MSTWHQKISGKLRRLQKSDNYKPANINLIFARIGQDLKERLKFECDQVSCKIWLSPTKYILYTKDTHIACVEIILKK